MPLARAFVSYASEDRDAVLGTCAELAKLDIEPVYYEDQIAAGGAIVDWIDGAIRNTDLSILFISNAYLSKQWTRAEYKAILHRYCEPGGAPFICVRMERGLEHPPLMNIVRHLDWSEPGAIAREVALAFEKGKAIDVGSGARTNAILRNPSHQIDLADLGDAQVVALTENILDDWYVMRGDPTAHVETVAPSGRTVVFRLDARMLELDDVRFEMRTQVELVSVHMQTAAILQRELAKGGLGVFVAAFEMRLNEALRDLEASRQRLRRALNALAAEITLLGGDM